MTQPTIEPETPHWKLIKSVDELTKFYKSVIPAMRTTAREHGYALGSHGSMRRDLDVIAVPWIDKYSSPDILANALMKAASGFTHGPISWEQKPNGRIATALPICWPEWDGCHSIVNLGHMDLSVMPSAALTAKADNGWQPIETAPKDGVTKALYGCFHDGKWYEQITKRGSGVGGLHVNVPTGFRKYTGATHWAPLPQPPAHAAAKDGAG